MENYIIYPKQMRRNLIPVEKNRCFFLMPFNHDFDFIYGKIKKFLNDNEFICNRADEISGSTPIISKILTEIMKSQYIIVDITNSNPKVNLIKVKRKNSHRKGFFHILFNFLRHNHPDFSKIVSISGFLINK